MYCNNDIRAYVDSVIKLSKQPLDKPLNLEKILKKLYLKVIYFDKESLDEENQNIRGILDYQKKKIYVRNEKIRSRMRFTLAHEIGHYILPDHIDHFSQEQKNCTDDIWNARDNAFEIEANLFASELLFKGSCVGKLYINHPSVDFIMINEIATETDVSFEATSRHLISNAPGQQILFIYNKEQPEKHPSIISSNSVSNSQAMQIFKPYFFKEMLAKDEKTFKLEALIFNKFIIGVNVEYYQNDYKKYYIMTVDKLLKK